MNGPLVTYDFHWCASDGFSWSFPVYSLAPFAPQSIAGYSLEYALRQDFGDSLGRLVDVHSGFPTVGGSSITLSLFQTVPCLVTLTLSTADAATFLVPRCILGQSQTRFYHQVWLTPPGAPQFTAIAGRNYMRNPL